MFSVIFSLTLSDELIKTHQDQDVWGLTPLRERSTDELEAEQQTQEVVAETPPQRWGGGKMEEHEYRLEFGC